MHQLGIMIFSYPFSYGIESVGITPLGQDIDIFHGDGIRIQGNSRFTDNIHAQFRQKIGDAMVDKRVQMIGPAGKHNNCPFLFLRPGYQRFRPRFKFFLVVFLRRRSFFHAHGHRPAINSKPLEKERKLFF